MFKNSFSFEGRIRRTEYGISFIILIVARVIITLIVGGLMLSAGIADESDFDNSGAIILSLILSSPLLWFFWAQGAKRCHDVNWSGWMQLIPFIPFLLIFMDGDKDANEYGENPKLENSSDNF